MEFLPEPLRAALPASVLDAPPAAVAAAVAVVLLSLYLVLKPSGGRAFRGWKAGPGGVFLSKQRVAVPLVARTQMSPDVVRFRFGLPTPTTVLGLPIGSHFKVFAPNVVGTEPGKWNGRDDSEAGHSEIERKYTPTSSDEDLGYFELMLKIYSGGEKPQFVDGGKMSQFLDSLEIGDCVDIQGPFGMTKYEGKGAFVYGRRPLQAAKIGMLAGGTGITPMLQIIAAILRDPLDLSEISLVFANQTEADICCRDELEKLRAAHPKRFRLHYTLDRPPSSGWAGSTGFITPAMLEAHLPPPGPDTVVLCCGPPPMVKFACKANLDKLDYPKDRVLCF